MPNQPKPVTTGLHASVSNEPNARAVTIAGTPRVDVRLRLQRA